MTRIFIFLAVILLVLVTLFVVFLVVRHFQRKKETYKRSLDLVIMKISLPPVSDDIDNPSRDQRDIVEENISKAQVLYNILASTGKKSDFKLKYYGQEYFGFEIVAHKGFVDFYAVTPISMVSIFKQAITSAYPGSKIEETTDHNIFSDKYKLEGVSGSELVLKKSFVYPVSSYIESKTDIMQPLLGSLSNLSKKEGACIQILMRPAYKDWAKSAKPEIDKIKKQKSKFFNSLLLAFFKSSDDQENKNEELSDLKKNLIKSIEEKTTKSAFESVIRVVVSTSNPERSKNINRNIVSSFSLLNQQDRNGFQPAETKKLDKLVTDFNLRRFPVSKNQLILNVNEVASIFHLPDGSSIPTSQLERQASKQVDAPRNIPKEGLVLGENIFRGNKREIILSQEDRVRHTYIIGQTGTGKSVLLENLILQDVHNNRGFALVDPHGETAERVLSQIPESSLDKVIYFNPSNMEYPVGLNIFEHDPDKPDQQDFLIQEAVHMLYKLYDPQNQGIIGPRYEYMFRNTAKLIMSDPAGGTFIDIPKLLNDTRFVLDKLVHVNDQSVIDFWTKEMPDAATSQDFGDIKSWFVSKFSAFLSNNMMRNIIGQTKSSFDLKDIMDNKKMMIVNLSKGQVGKINMKLLGMILVTKFQMEATGRAAIPPHERQDFTLYVDEFQNFATDSFADILSEARKYRLSLVLANQFTTQLKEEIRDAVYGNVGTAVSFRLNSQDAEDMVKQFYGKDFTIDDLTSLPLANTIVRTLVNGSPTKPFSMVTKPPLLETDLVHQQKKIDYLAKKHGRPRKEVEEEISRRLSARSHLRRPQA